MNTWQKLVVALGFSALVAAPAARGDVLWHDPWLNWDFQNISGQLANDFEIIVDSPTFNPAGQVLLGAPFPSFGVSNGDFDGDGDQDTKLTWSGAAVNPGQVAHIGAYMSGSGLVQDAYWTQNGVKVGPSLAITYEMTEIRGDPEVHMHLNIAPGFFEDTPGGTAGWQNIRTFINVPADLLGLEDINDTLDLSALAAYEVTPIDASTGLPITGSVMRTDDSPFDVFLGNIDAVHASPDFEALLYAEVFDGARQGVIGQFWNLNPQSPEPATLVLLAVGGMFVIKRRR
jgi:hypothetical protein